MRPLDPNERRWAAAMFPRAPVDTSPRIPVPTSPRVPVSTGTPGSVDLLTHGQLGRSGSSMKNPQEQPSGTNVLCVVNRKGGVAKTTTAVNLAAVLANDHGQRVLLIDLDSRGDASLALGNPIAKADESPAFRALYKRKSLVDECIRTPFGFDLLPAGEDLVDCAEKLNHAIARNGHMALKTAIARCPDTWDTVLLDCPPDYGMMTVIGLVAASRVVVPTILHYLPKMGLGDLKDTIEDVRESHNPGLKIDAVVGTIIQENSNHAVKIRAEIEQMLGAAMLPMRIRQCTKLADAQEAHMPITSYWPDCSGALDYRALATHLVQMGVA